MIDLYAAGTSNGMRARIAVEECGLAYRFHPIDIQKGEQKLPGFLAMNPMGQIPVLVDNEGPGGKDRKSTRLNSSHSQISYAVFCLKKKKKTHHNPDKTHAQSRNAHEQRARIH